MSKANDVKEFSAAIAKMLGHYVYRLIDPRDGETFYIGKGVGNRIFGHARGEPGYDGSNMPEKLERIREIRNTGLEPIHVIHRHGMDAETAFEVEAALIDAFPGLSNLVGGHESGDRGPMHVWEIKQRYEAEVADFSAHKVMLISVNRSATKAELYDSTRYSWRLNPAKAKQADVVLATQQGLIIGAFVADEWLPATPENFPGFPVSEGRWGFVGRQAPRDIREQYINTRVPDSMRKRGAANPIRYSF